MECQTMTLERQGAVARLTFTRPEKLNAISQDFIKDLAAVGMALTEDTQTRVVIVTGAGRAFSAGADIAEFPKEPSPELTDKARVGSRLGLRALRGFVDLEQITIAAINGWAIGGGLSLAMACDIRFAAEGTCFFIPEVDFGVPYLWTSAVLLTRLVGPAKAKELILTCDRFTAEQAQQWGILQRVVPAEQLASQAAALAAKIAAKPYAAVRQTKMVINAISAPYGEIAGYDAELASLCRALGDFGTAQQAFQARR